MSIRNCKRQYVVHTYHVGPRGIFEASFRKPMDARSRKLKILQRNRAKYLARVWMRRRMEWAKSQPSPLDFGSSLYLPKLVRQNVTEVEVTVPYTSK